MKILFIHEVNYETKVIFEIQEFPELLAIQGHQVDFLHFPEHVGIKNASFKTKVRKISGRVYDQARINLITPPTFGGSFIDRLISTITIIPLLWRLISKEKYDVIVLYAVPTSGWQASIIAKIKGVPLIFRALDVSHLLRSGLTEQLVKVAEWVVYRNATLISANNSALGSYCRYISGKPLPMKVNVPPLDFSHFQEQKDQVLREKFGLQKNDFVLMFMGTFYEFSGIPKVIKELKNYPDQGLKVILVGGGKQEIKIREMVIQLELEKEVIFTGVIPYQQLPEIFSVADVAFNSFEPILISNVAFPHKVLQYLAAGIPTISTKLDGLYSSLGDRAGVIWVDKPEDVVKAAIELRNASTVTLNEMKNVGQNFITKNFDKNNSVIDFEKTILLVAEGNHHG